VKLKLLFCLPALFFLTIQGMQPTEINTTQLSLAIQYGLDINKKDCHKFIVNYFKSTSPATSAQEMYVATKAIVENYAQKTSTIDNIIFDESHIKLYPNEELNKQSKNSSLPQLLFMMKNKTWETASQLVNSSNSSFNNYNCDLIIYHIPNNDVLPMANHMQQIMIANCLDCNATVILNIDSAIQDDVLTTLAQDAIVTRIGFKDKPASFLSLHKGKIFVFGGFVVIIALVVGCMRYKYLCNREAAIQNGMAG